MPIGVRSALEFLDRVKEVYGAESPQYRGLMDVLKDFKAGSADTRETTRRIIALFQGHPELIEGYAAFLPPGNAIQLPAGPQQNIFVTMTTGTMEVARDGTVVNETRMPPGNQGVGTALPNAA